MKSIVLLLISITVNEYVTGCRRVCVFGVACPCCRCCHHESVLQHLRLHLQRDRRRWQSGSSAVSAGASSRRHVHGVRHDVRLLLRQQTAAAAAAGSRCQAAAVADTHRSAAAAATFVGVDTCRFARPTIHFIKRQSHAISVVVVRISAGGDQVGGGGGGSRPADHAAASSAVGKGRRRRRTWPWAWIQSPERRGKTTDTDGDGPRFADDGWSPAYRVYVRWVTTLYYYNARKDQFCKITDLI